MRKTLLSSTALMTLVLGAAPAWAAGPEFQFDIPAESLSQALTDFSAASAQQIIFSEDVVKGRRIAGLHGRFTSDAALSALLSGTDLRAEVNASGVLMVQPKNVRAALDGAASAGGLAAANGTASSNDFETVVVSAQKKDERLADAPVPVTVVNTNRLTDNGEVRLRDYQSSIPGLRLSPSYEQNSILTIRGITTGNSPIPTVGFVVDDVPFGNPIAQSNSLPDIDPGDLDRIEVLRGPQGTLYGASSMGGLIKFVTKTPSTDGFSGRIEFGTESTYNSAEPGFQVRGSLNIPVSDDFAFRVSAFQRQEGGYVDDPTLNLKGVNVLHSYGARFSGLWTPFDNVSITLSALYQDDRGDGVPDITVAPGVGDLQQKFIPNVGPSDRVTQAYSMTVKADFDGFHVQSLTGYNSSHYTDIFDMSNNFGANNAKYFGAANNGAAYSDDFRPQNITEEIRATTTIGDDLDLLIGGFLANDHNHLRQIDFAENPVSGQIVGAGDDGTYLYGYHEYAGFADLTYRFTDRLSLQVGGRYSSVENRTGPYNIVEPIFTGNTVPVIQNVLDAHFEPFTYLVTPQYKISDDMMVYGRFSSGFRPGGGNLVFPSVPVTFTPDTTKNYELGFKGNILDGAVFVDASLYYIDWNNIQIQERTTTNHGYTGNGGQAKSEGVEISLETHPWTGMSFTAWGDYDDAVLTQAFPSGATVAGLVGDRLPISPAYSANFSADQEFPLWNDVMGFASGQISYVGDRLGVFLAGGQTRQYYPAYTQVDMNIGAKMNDWTLNIYADNLTDERGVLQGGTGYSNPTTFYYITPRTVGLSISKSF